MSTDCSSDETTEILKKQCATNIGAALRCPVKVSSVHVKGEGSEDKAHKEANISVVYPVEAFGSWCVAENLASERSKKSESSREVLGGKDAS